MGTNSRRFADRKSTLAVGPNQVWSWDITKLLGPVKRTYDYLYVLLDIFSRYMVGWLVEQRDLEMADEGLGRDLPHLRQRYEGSPNTNPYTRRWAPRREKLAQGTAAAGWGALGPIGQRRWLLMLTLRLVCPAAAGALPVTASTVVAEAQQSRKMPHIGVLVAGSAQDTLVKEFLEGLRQLGYHEGRNVSMTYRVAGGHRIVCRNWPRSPCPAQRSESGQRPPRCC